MALLEQVVRDARVAVRVLRRHPRFALMTIATLALGVGANVAIVSVVRAILKPLPYAHSDGLVSARRWGQARRTWFWPCCGTPSIGGTGVAIGLVLALSMARTVDALLFGMNAYDGTTYAGAACAVVTAVLGASAFPGWRAARLAPVSALKAD